MKTTIDMAREAGMVYREFEDEFANANTDGVDLITLKAFEALVRADERETCAKVAADYGPSRPIVSKNPAPQIVGRWEGEQAASAGIEAAIRARGNA
jgi:hypothetical protein